MTLLRATTDTQSLTECEMAFLRSSERNNYLFLRQILPKVLPPTGQCPGPTQDHHEDNGMPCLPAYAHGESYHLKK